MPDGMRSRPAANRAATKDNWVTVEGVSILPETVSRCRRCGHPITAERSLRWLLGPDCRRIVERLLGCPLADVERVDGSWSA